MEFWLTIGAWAFLIFFLGFSIMIHEIGHFLAAKWRGLHIDAFSIGFKKIWGKKINGVEYRIGCLPFGGYVELPQVDSATMEPKAADGTILCRAKPLDRIIVAIAGPLFNILFALLLGCLIWIWGKPEASLPMREIKVAHVDEAGAEYAAGLRKNDVITEVNGQRFNLNWSSFVTDFYLFGTGETTFTVIRGESGETLNIKFTPQASALSPLPGEEIVYPSFLPVVPLELTPWNGGVAERAGIHKGDILISIDGKYFVSGPDAQYAINESGGKELTFLIRRGDSTLELTLTPEKNLVDERYLVGVEMRSSDEENSNVIIEKVSPDMPAAKATLQAGDRLISVDGITIKGPSDFSEHIKKLKDKPMQLSILRAGKTEVEIITLAAQKVDLYTVDTDFISRSYPNPIKQFTDAIDNSYKSLRGIFIGFGNNLGLTSKQSSIKPKHLSSIIGIGDALYKSVRYDFFSGIYFVAMIGFLLAVFNLLPLPILDGGHIVFALFEIIFRRPIPVKFQQGLSYLFFVLLIGLMLYATFNDLKRIGSRESPGTMIVIILIILCFVILALIPGKKKE